jgi:hypothetical protein
VTEVVYLLPPFTRLRNFIKNFTKRKEAALATFDLILNKEIWVRLE